MNIADRLKAFLDQKGINNRDADQRFGFSNGLTGKFLTGKTNLGIDKVEEILKVFPELSADWLIRGIGPMYLSEGMFYPTEAFETPSVAEEPRVPIYEADPDQVWVIDGQRRIRAVTVTMDDLQQRLIAKDETIAALKETIQVYKEMAGK